MVSQVPCISFDGFDKLDKTQEMIFDKNRLSWKLRERSQLQGWLQRGILVSRISFDVWDGFI